MIAYPEIEYYLSTYRLNRYLVATSGDKELAISLYFDSLKLSQFFYPLLSTFEVVLRNSIDQILTAHFNDHSWIMAQRSGFMDDNSLSHRNKNGKIIHKRYMKNEVEKAIQKIQKSGKPTAPKVIAEMKFGFWNAFYDNQYYKLLLGKPIQVFNHLPPNISRSNIFHSLTKIRDFRNRISHNEPICFNGTGLDLMYPENIYGDIIRLLEWIDVDLKQWISPLDNVKSQINYMQNKYY